MVDKISHGYLVVRQAKGLYRTFNWKRVASFCGKRLQGNGGGSSEFKKVKILNILMLWFKK